MKATDAVKRAVKIAKEALEKQGHKLVPFNVTFEEYKTFRTFFY